MKALVVAATITVTLCVPNLPGQGGAAGPGRMGGGARFPGGGPARGGPSMGFHTGPFRQSGKFGNQFGFGNKFGFGNTFGFGRFGNGFGFAGLDPYYAAYGYGFDPFFDPFYANYASLGNHDDYQQPAQPSVVVMMPQVQMPPPPVIMPPIRPEIRDYNWPVSSPDSAAAFTLVRKDQRVDSAIAVTVEGNVISYITPDGLHRQMNMDTLDREKTRQRNATKRLRMPWLAGGQE